MVYPSLRKIGGRVRAPVRTSLMPAVRKPRDGDVILYWARVHNWGRIPFLEFWSLPVPTRLVVVIERATRLQRVARLLRQSTTQVVRSCRASSDRLLGSSRGRSTCSQTITTRNDPAVALLNNLTLATNSYSGSPRYADFGGAMMGVVDTFVMFVAGATFGTLLTDSLLDGDEALSSRRRIMPRRVRSRHVAPVFRGQLWITYSRLLALLFTNSTASACESVTIHFLDNVRSEVSAAIRLVCPDAGDHARS